MRKIPALVTVAAFSLLGIGLLAATHAATPSASAEVENATIGGNASLIAGNGASGIGSIKFGVAGGANAYGLPAMTNLSRLAMLQPDIRGVGQSSYERNGGNADTGQFMYTTSNGEKVMEDLRGPGVIYRIWTTGFGANDWIKVYFDGETTPRINMNMNSFFSGNTAPFLSPLVVPNTVSSGGFVSYLPLPFAKSIRITTNMNNYFNVGSHMLAKDAVITSWTGREDSSAARTLWTGLGKDPHNETGATAANNTVSVASGASQSLLDTDGSGQVTSLKLNIPGLADNRTVSDNGRAHKGTSRFTMNIDPANTGVILTRRLDLDIAYQKATVLVDGVSAGTWFDGGPEVNRFFDSNFDIPANLTAGKSSITVTIQFVASQTDWNEFAYTAFSATPSGVVQTDTLNVGDATSETAHAYTIAGQTWTGTKSLTYNSADTLNNLRLRMYWDNEKTPSVDAPLGMFFGMGRFGVGTSHSLLMGRDSNGVLYAYFPMPFGQHANIQLVNMRSTATPNVVVEIKRQPLSSIGLNMSQLAYFKTQYHTTAPEKLNEDIPLLDADGQGKFIGVTNSYTGAPTRWYLEGDERIYVDGSSSPTFHGTGTEDFFNGGWYFDHGQYSNALSGNPADLGSSYSASTTAYRLFAQDAPPYRSHISASIEHGGTDDTTDNAWTLAYYYNKPAQAMKLTDTLDVGKTDSETAHNYSITGQTFNGSATLQYEGLYSLASTNLTDDGRAHKGTSQFTMAIDPANHGVLLRRRFDQRIINQEADIYVDGQKTGTMYKTAGNATRGWRDEDYIIPAKYTAGKSQITVKVQFVSSSVDWNEYLYKAFSIY